MSGERITPDFALLSMMQRKAHAKTPDYNANGIAKIIDQADRETFTSAVMCTGTGTLNVHLIGDFDKSNNPVFCLIDIDTAKQDVGVCFDQIKQTGTTIADLSTCFFWI